MLPLPLTHPLSLLLSLLLTLWPLLGRLLLSLPSIYGNLGDCHLKFLVLEGSFFVAHYQRISVCPKGYFWTDAEALPKYLSGSTDAEALPKYLSGSTDAEALEFFSLVFLRSALLEDTPSPPPPLPVPR